MGGVIALTLTACGTDSVYDEIDQENADMNAPPTFNDGASGWHIPGGTSVQPKNYFSPWDIWRNRGASYHGLQPSYAFGNGDVEGNYSPYELHVFAWVGLAYFDGTNDGVFNDASQPLGSQQKADMAGNPTLFPNLYTINNGQPQEVGNLVKAATPLIFQPYASVRVEDIEHHLPMPDVPVGAAVPRYKFTPPPYNWGAWADGFNLPVGTTITQDEDDLLRDYGKVFFYEVEVFEAGTLVGTYILHPEIQTLYDGSTPYWEPVNDLAGGTQQQASLPFGTFPLHYYTNGTGTATMYNPNSVGGAGNKCNSYEVVLDAPNMHTYTIAGSVPKKLTMGFWQHHQTFWQRSALALTVEN